MIKVYTASLTKHAQLWDSLVTSASWSDIYLTASWPATVIRSGDVSPNDPARCCEVWKMDEEEIRESDVVMIYAKGEQEILRGALVEAGMAIAMGKLVLIVGQSPSWGTWQWHPNCFHAADLSEARLILRAWNKDREVRNAS